MPTNRPSNSKSTIMSDPPSDSPSTYSRSALRSIVEDPAYLHVDIGTMIDVFVNLKETMSVKREQWQGLETNILVHV